MKTNGVKLSNSSEVNWATIRCLGAIVYIEIGSFRAVIVTDPCGLPFVLKFMEFVIQTTLIRM